MLTPAGTGSAKINLSTPNDGARANSPVPSSEKPVDCKIDGPASFPEGKARVTLVKGGPSVAMLLSD